ncbi:hypothetical protein HK105_208456 [Polyrhizophydium stewartii]|uniref:Uncharacterized protein n=1 Tax=Polyrhizophydium stewartii TaxID=2732419 RepID=A0ABR4MXJ7_9FUNG
MHHTLALAALLLAAVAALPAPEEPVASSSSLAAPASTSLPPLPSGPSGDDKRKTATAGLLTVLAAVGAIVALACIVSCFSLRRQKMAEYQPAPAQITVPLGSLAGHGVHAVNPRLRPSGPSAFARFFGFRGSAESADQPQHPQPAQDARARGVPSMSFAGTAAPPLPTGPAMPLALRSTNVVYPVPDHLPLPPPPYSGRASSDAAGTTSELALIDAEFDAESIPDDLSAGVSVVDFGPPTYAQSRGPSSQSDRNSQARPRSLAPSNRTSSLSSMRAAELSRDSTST